MSERRTRVALALSGGGSKGAFTVGALKVLRQKYGLDRFSVISGTSTGSLIGTMLAANDWSTLVDVYSNVRTKHIVNRNYPNIARFFGTEAVLLSCALFGGRAIFDTKALEATIHANVRWEAVKDAAVRAEDPTLLVYSTVDLLTGDAKTFNSFEHEAGVLERALLASSNQPVLMDPVEIDGRAGQYVDGGVREFLPLEGIFEYCVAPDDPDRARREANRGSKPLVEVDAIVAISTSPDAPQTTKEPLGKITDILARAIELLNTEVGKDDFVGAQRVNALLRIVANARKAKVPEALIWDGVPDEVRTRFERKKSIDLWRIAPEEHLEMNGLEFEPIAMRKAMDLGVQAAKKALAAANL